jgi:putative membrane protein
MPGQDRPAGLQHGGKPMMGLGMGVGLLLLLLFWGLLIAGAVWLAKAVLTGRLRPGGEASDPDLSPRQILDQRYARGEIGAEEYQLIRGELDQS